MEYTKRRDTYINTPVTYKAWDVFVEDGTAFKALEAPEGRWSLLWYMDGRGDFLTHHSADSLESLIEKIPPRG